MGPTTMVRSTPDETRTRSLPRHRGPLSRRVLELLSGDPDAGFVHEPPDLTAVTDPVADGDLQIALWMLYELHFRGLEGVDPDWECAPAALALRRDLERHLEASLVQAVRGEVDVAMTSGGDVADRFFGLTETFPAPALSSFIGRRADRDQVREFLAHRSVYQLKEADPHSFALPRLRGEAKARFVEVQFDEYGSGQADRMHQDLFARTLAASGLDPTYAGYVDAAPGVTLALGNVVSLFALRRRWRGAAVGHLAAVEATSSLPCRLYASGVRRVGLPDEAAEFFDEHVEADAVHEQLAVRGACAALVAQEPALERDVFTGAACYLYTEARFAERLLAAWADGRTALLPSPPVEATA